MRAFFTKMLRACGYWDLQEPFKGLFTQGMVCHKTFRAQDGSWLFPSDVSRDGFSLHDGHPVTIGRSEKMSKSKCNVVGVTEMVQTYGADAVRLFLLSDTPPQKDLEWTDKGIEGAWRYVRRVWSLMAEKTPLCQEIFWPSESPQETTDLGNSLRRATHKTVQKINQAVADYALNKYVAYLREFGHSIQDFIPTSQFEKWALKEALVIFVQMMAPMMPHLSEEVGHTMGVDPGIHKMPWPQVRTDLLVSENVTLSVQVNGKHRGVLSVPQDIDKESLCKRVRQDPKLAPYIQGQWKRVYFRARSHDQYRGSKLINSLTFWALIISIFL